MKTQTITYVSSFDEQKLTGYHYATQKPKALVAIFHGMAEHQKRYIWLAEQLVKADFDVLTIDQRGHGESLYDGKVKGYFADQDGWERNLADLHAIVEIVRTNTGLPLIVLGHSMGTLVARCYLKRYPQHIKAIYLSGSLALNPLASTGSFLAKVIALFKGKKYHSPLLGFMTYRIFNTLIKNPRTLMDGLSVDTKNVDVYIADELCGFHLTAQGFADMMGGMIETYESKGWIVHDKDVPIRFVSGREDPFFLPGGLEKASKCLKDIGYQNVSFDYIDGVRHEIFNDVKKGELADDLVAWLGKILASN